MVKEILDSKMRILELNSKLKSLKEKVGFVIQSLLFPRTAFSLEKAKNWAGPKGFKTSKHDETEGFIHLQQKIPSRFKNYKTVSLGEGVMARIAGNLTSKFTGSVYLSNISKMSNAIPLENVKSDLDLKIPMVVDMHFLCEGINRDGAINREDLENSISQWAGMPILDWHDMSDMKNPTAHKLTDRKGYLGPNPQIKEIDGKLWIVDEAYITDRYLAYLIYLAEKMGKPLEVSPEYAWTPYWNNGVKHQSNIKPHLVTIVDKGHLEGNKLAILSD